MNVRVRLASILVLVLALPAAALPNPFGPSPAQERAALLKYCGAEAPTEQQLLALDLSVIEKAADAAALAGAYRRAGRATDQMLGGLEVQMEGKRGELERHFRALYGAEIHDELWQQTRPLKQAAYKKTVTEMLALDDQYDAGTAKLLRLKNFDDALTRISREFREIQR